MWSERHFNLPVILFSLPAERILAYGLVFIDFSFRDLESGGLGESCQMLFCCRRNCIFVISILRK